MQSQRFCPVGLISMRRKGSVLSRGSGQGLKSTDFGSQRFNPSSGINLGIQAPLALEGIHLSAGVFECLVVDHSVAVVHRRAFVAHDVAARLRVDPCLAHLEMSRPSQIVKMEGQWFKAVGLRLLSEQRYRIVPEAVKARDGFPVFVKPIVEPKEYVRALREKEIAAGLLLPKRILHFAHERRLSRAEFRRFEVDTPLVEIHTVPWKAQQLAQAATNVVADHEQAAKCRMERIPER
jgi:hypothetical protein